MPLVRLESQHSFGPGYNVIAVDIEAQPRTERRDHGAVARNGNFRNDQIAREVSRARRNITGEHEPGQARQRDVVRPADA